MTSSFLFYSGSQHQQLQPHFNPKDFINSSVTTLSTSTLLLNSSCSTPLNNSNGIPNNSNNNNNNPLSGSGGISNGSNNTPTSESVIDIDQCLKHCGCRNPKELIQLIRSDAIESIEISWPDDMGLWYMNTIKSHEVSLQNLVEGVRVAGQLLLLDPSSARFDLSKKLKTIVVRSANIDQRSSSSMSSEDDDCYEDDELGEDGEMVKSPQQQSKFSCLLDESEKFRKTFSSSSGNNHLKKSSRSAFKKNKNSGGGGGGSGGGSGVVSFDSNGLPIFDQQPYGINNFQNGDGYIPQTPSSSHYGGLGKSTTSLGKRQYRDQQQQNQQQHWNNGGNGGNNLSMSDEDLDASWLEEIKRNRVEVVPDLSSPALFSMDKRSPSPSLGSSCGSSSPSIPVALSNSNNGNEITIHTDGSDRVLVGGNGSLSASQCPPNLANIDSAEKAILEGQIHLPPLLRPRQYHACKTSKENRPTKRRKNHTSLFCRHCGTTDTPEWRRGPDGRKSLCNACGLHYSKLVKRENMAVPELSRTFELSDILNPSD